MAAAEMDHMALYLRTFFRLLSTWGHGEKSWGQRGVVPDSTISSCPVPIATFLTVGFRVMLNRPGVIPDA